MKYGRLVVFIRHDFAEIWGFRYGLKHVIDTLKIMAGTGVFAHVVCALKHSIKNSLKHLEIFLATHTSGTRDVSGVGL
jgi:hypothetical protein